MNINSKTNKGTFLELLLRLKLSELITILSIFILIPGFIIVNIYLGDFGIHDFSLFKMKYLSAGLLFIAILTIYIFFVWRKIYYAEEDVGNIATTLIAGTTSKLGNIFWGILSMMIVMADNAFGIILASSLVSSIFFASKAVRIIFVILMFYFLIDYSLVKLKIPAKSPRVFFPLNGFIHSFFVFLFFYTVDEKEPIKLFWTFLLVTFFVNLILDMRKKLTQNGSYITKLSFFDLVWILIFVISLAISFGKFFYEKIDPALGGGRPISVSLIVDQKDIPIFQRLQIKVDQNLSEKVSLISQSENELYVVKSEEIEGKAIQLSKKLIQGIIYY